jgi:hypothetical protein
MGAMPEETDHLGISRSRPGLRYQRADARNGSAEGGQ